MRLPLLSALLITTQLGACTSPEQRAHDDAAFALYQAKPHGEVRFYLESAQQIAFQCRTSATNRLYDRVFDMNVARMPKYDLDALRAELDEAQRSGAQQIVVAVGGSPEFRDANEAFRAKYGIVARDKVNACHVSSRERNEDTLIGKLLR